MALSFAAITPHPPILVPQIGKEHIQRLKTTENAFAKLAETLENSQTETLLVISPHGQVQQGSFTMNLNPEFSADFSEFGDLATNRTWQGNIGMTHRIRESLETTAPLQLTSSDKLDHGVSVPLYLLTREQTRIKVIPLYYSGLPNEAHFKFGQLLKKEILASKEQIGVIASGDLSHRLSRSAPAGYSSKGKKFDKRLVSYLKEKKYSQLLQIDDDLVHEAGECGLKSILILAGLLENIRHTPQLLSYEAPFGVGYMVMNFRF